MRLTIAPKGDKGRSFSAELLACAEADRLWDGGGTDTKSIRPVWAVFGGSELELRAFMANLMTGKVATVEHAYRSSTKYELLKSAGYAHHTVKVGGGAVTTVYLPDLFCLDPGMVDPDVVRFVVVPPKAWVDAQTFDVVEARAILEQLAGQPWDTTDEKMRVLLAEGVLFLAYLDRRCRYPIPFAPAFGAWLVMVCQQKRMLVRGGDRYDSTFKVTGAERVQALPGFTFDTTHELLGKVLSEEVRQWFPARERANVAQLEQWLDSLGSV